jgi:hypothetical protein
VTEDLWIPLVDEAIGEIIVELEHENPDLQEALDTPQKLLAFRTFANIRVGMVLGRQLVERDLAPGSEGDPWVRQLAAEPEVRAELLDELRDLAQDLADEDEDEAAVPDEAARDRFRAFARRTLVDE